MSEGREIQELLSGLSKRELSRREFIKAATALGISSSAISAFLAACAPKPAPPTPAPATPTPAPATPTPAPPTAKSIMIQPWPGTYEEICRKCIYDPFTEQFGVEIKTTATVEWYNIAKIKQEVESGNPTLHLSVQLPGDVARGGRDGLFEEIDPDNVPNLKDVVDEAKTLMPYGVGYCVYSYGIGYRPGTGTFESWWDLWDPKYKGRVTIGKYHTSYIVGFLNRLITGKMVPVDIDAVFEKLDELKPNILKMFESDADIRNMYNANEIDACVFFNSRVAMMADDGLDIKFSSPEEGALAAFDYLSITKGSQLKELAEQLIDFHLAPEPQYCMGVYQHLGPTNKTVTFEDPKYCAMMPCAEDYPNLWFEDPDYVAEHQDEWIERWNEWLVGA